jgi:hypothetical protein
MVGAAPRTQGARRCSLLVLLAELARWVEYLPWGTKAFDKNAYKYESGYCRHQSNLLQRYFLHWS